MRLPAYLLLPILSAVVLVAVVLGSWMWPAPDAPAPSVSPPVLSAPVAVAPPAPPPAAFKSPPASPVVRSQPVRPSPPPEQALAPVPRPVEPEVVPPPPAPPPGVPAGIQATPLSPERQAEVNQIWRSVKERTAEKVLEAIKELERQRAEAQERGDQVEADRLEQLITAQREGVEELRGLRPPKSYPSRWAPGVPAEPPRQ